MNAMPLLTQTKLSEELSPELPERLKQISELSAFTTKVVSAPELLGKARFPVPVPVPASSLALILT